MNLEDKVYQLNELVKYKDVQIAQMQEAIKVLTYINETNQQLIKDLKNLLEQEKVNK